jgi:hypothetical protein
MGFSQLILYKVFPTFYKRFNLTFKLNLIVLFQIFLQTGCIKTGEKENENTRIVEKNNNIEQIKQQKSKLIDLKIFIHDSKSMDGFRFLGSQLGDDVLNFFTSLEDPQNQLGSKINSFTLLTKDAVHIKSIGDGIKALADYIYQTRKVDGVTGKFLKGVNKDFSKILDKVIEESLEKPNSVSAFLTDLVYYPGEAEGRDLKKYLNGQSQLMRLTIQTALSKNPDLCMVLLRGVSEYKWDKRITRNRPYYLIFLGKKSNLKPVMGFAQKNWKGNYFWFELLKNPVNPKLVVSRGHPWAKGTYETNFKVENLIIDPNLRPGNSEFSFVSEVELNEFNGLEFLLIDRSKYIGGDWAVSKIGIEPKYKSNLKGAFQFEIKTRNKLKPGEFEIRLPYYYPKWISQSSHAKPEGSILETEFEGKTFGFEPLMNGVLEAFHIGEKDLIHLKFKIER